MVMLWAFVIASALCAGAAGASAVMLVRDGQSDVSRLRAETHVLTERCDTAQKQIDALRIVLGQAQQWIAAQKAVHAADHAADGAADGAKDGAKP